MRLAHHELAAARRIARDLLTEAVDGAAADRYAGDCAIILVVPTTRAGQQVTLAQARAWYEQYRSDQPVAANGVRVFNRTEDEFDM